MVLLRSEDPDFWKVVKMEGFPNRTTSVRTLGRHTLKKEITVGITLPGVLLNDKWTPHQDKELMELVKLVCDKRVTSDVLTGTRNLSEDHVFWETVGKTEGHPNRTTKVLKVRWGTIKKKVAVVITLPMFPKIKKWTSQQDKKLMELVKLV